MSDSSEDSIDMSQIEHEMIKDEYMKLLKEYKELVQENNEQQSKDQNVSVVENFEQEWQNLVQRKKEIDDKINELDIQKQQQLQELETQQDILIQVKEAICKNKNELQEKEQLVKILSKQLKDM